MSIFAELFVAIRLWRDGLGRDDRKPFCFTSVSSIPDPVVQRFVRTETVFVILILRLLILFQGQES